jgi:hypothetical protein
MQNCVLYLVARFSKPLEKPNKYASNVFSHLENLLIYQLIFGKLLEMLLVEVWWSQICLSWCLKTEQGPIVIALSPCVANCSASSSDKSLTFV